VNPLDNFRQGVDVNCGGNIVRFVLVICANIDDNDIRGWTLAEIPWLWVV
jgi:hypothetical protein